MESHFLRKFSGIEKKLTHGATLLLASLEEAKLGCFATSLAPLEIRLSAHWEIPFNSRYGSVSATLRTRPSLG